MKVWPIFPFFPSSSKEAPYYLHAPLSQWKPPIYYHAICPSCANSLLFRHLLSRLAVALIDCQSRLGWEMSLINYTCKPGLFLNWIFHWMIQVSVKGSESQPSRTFGRGKRRRQVRGKYNAHLSSLKLRLDDGRDVLVIIRRERMKESWKMRIPSL